MSGPWSPARLCARMLARGAGEVLVPPCMLRSVGGCADDKDTMRGDGITFEGERADGMPTHMVIDGERMAFPTRAEIAATEEREEGELSEDWDGYCALTFAEKIRQEGVMSWLLHTNTGVTVMLVFGLALALAVVSVLAALGLSR